MPVRLRCACAQKRVAVEPSREADQGGLLSRIRRNGSREESPATRAVLAYNFSTRLFDQRLGLLDHLNEFTAVTLFILAFAFVGELDHAG